LQKWRRFEINAVDLEAGASMAAGDDDDEGEAGEGAPTVFELRDHPVMLASSVAVIFGVETREIVQNIKNNNKGVTPMFPERYAFEATGEELDALRSAGLISKSGRGGSRALPWLVTRKGAIRLAMIMKSQKTIEAADILVDVFDEVLVQLKSGQRRITVANPALLRATRPDATFETLRKRFLGALEEMLNTEIDEGRGTTVKDELHETAAEAIGYVREWLRGKKVSNEKVEAETLLIVEQARDLYERRQADLADRRLDRERKALENFRLKISILKEAFEALSSLAPNAVIEMVEGFAQSAAALPSTNSIPNRGKPQGE
jgi:ORF6N domain